MEISHNAWVDLRGGSSGEAHPLWVVHPMVDQGSLRARCWISWADEAWKNSWPKRKWRRNKEKHYKNKNKRVYHVVNKFKQVGEGQCQGLSLSEQILTTLHVVLLLLCLSVCLSVFVTLGLSSDTLLRCVFVGRGRDSSRQRLHHQTGHTRRSTQPH